MSGLVLDTGDSESGDIYACWGSGWISRGISLETSLTSWLTGPPGLRFAPSHVAIAARWKEALCWYESTTLTTRHCLSAQRRVDGVQVHEIGDRIHDYIVDGGAVSVFRLTRINALESIECDRLQNALTPLLGTPDRTAIAYDTAGALFSGLRLLPKLPFARANLDTLFCSELLAASLQRLCRMNKRNPSVFNPGKLMRELVRQGTHVELRRFQQRDMPRDCP